MREGGGRSSEVFPGQVFHPGPVFDGHAGPEELLPESDMKGKSPKPSPPTHHFFAAWALGDLDHFLIGPVFRPE